jgi:hypothetical protein
VAALALVDAGRAGPVERGLELGDANVGKRARKTCAGAADGSVAWQAGRGQERVGQGWVSQAGGTRARRAELLGGGVVCWAGTVRGVGRCRPWRWLVVEHG